MAERTCMEVKIKHFYLYLLATETALLKLHVSTVAILVANQLSNPFFFCRVHNTSKGCMNSYGLRLAYIQNTTFKSTKRNSANYIVREIIPYKETVYGKNTGQYVHTDVQNTNNVQNERGNKDFWGYGVGKGTQMSY